MALFYGMTLLNTNIVADMLFTFEFIHFNLCNPLMRSCITFESTAFFINFPYQVNMVQCIDQVNISICGLFPLVLPYQF